MNQVDNFRDYSNVNQKVVETYRLNHRHQTYEYATEMKKKYCVDFDKAYMGIWDALELANQIVDESDPDIDLPQIHHSIQTAENLKMQFPNNKELHLIGLIHDLGKVMLLDDFGKLPQWSVVGDIYPLGCQFNNKIVFHEFFEDNPDNANHQYNTKYGIYKKNCGLDNITMSFSHDEYLYSVLKNNPNCKISNENLRIIRYHSFYPFHKENAYNYLANDTDMELKSTLHQFSNCDLYSKNNENKLNIEDLKPYYLDLINQYCPGKFNW